MTYPGGKNGSGVYQQIINRIPPHDTYIEPFIGGGAIMRMKRPARSSIGIDIDPDAIKKLQDLDTPNLTLYQTDAIKWLKDTLIFPDSFIYIDPPYLISTRSQTRHIYKNELTEEDHNGLLVVIKSLRCMVMISGYPNAIYDDALSSWQTAIFMTTNRGGGHVTEKLWMNYPPPVKLHDYRYLGNSFRERERIKRKSNRWRNRLLMMPELERFALMASIARLEDDLAATIASVKVPGQHRQEERTAPATIADSDGGRSTKHFERKHWK